MDSKNQKGSSLIEVLAVLTVISCATVGLYSGITNLYTRFRLTKGVSDVKDSIKGMRDYFASAPEGHYNSLTTEKLVNIGVFTNYYDAEKKYANNFLGLKTEMKISGEGEGRYVSDFAPSGGNQTFRLYYYDVPSGECFDLLLADWGNDPSSGLVEIAADDKKFRWTKDHGNGSYYTLPPDLENAHTACESETNTVTIYWEYFF